MHGEPPPQLHPPPDEQPSPRWVATQSTHIAPPVPHVVAERAAQAPVEVQQPEPQVDGPHTTHTPPMQVSPGAHWAPPPQLHAPEVHRSAVTDEQAVHAEPAVPQLESDGAVQLVPEQQPEGQEAALHTQAPETQA